MKERAFALHRCSEADPGRAQATIERTNMIFFNLNRYSARALIQVTYANHVRRYEGAMGLKNLCEKVLIAKLPPEKRGSLVQYDSIKVVTPTRIRDDVWEFPVHLGFVVPHFSMKADYSEAAIESLNEVIRKDITPRLMFAETQTVDGQRMQVSNVRVTAVTTGGLLGNTEREAIADIAELMNPMISQVIGGERFFDKQGRVSAMERAVGSPLEESAHATMKASRVAIRMGVDSLSLGEDFVDLADTTLSMTE